MNDPREQVAAFFSIIVADLGGSWYGIKSAAEESLANVEA